MLREDPDWPEGLEPLAERAIHAALAAGGRRLAGPAEISIVLTGDSEQRALNARWRGKDAPTNVLSFPQLEPDAPLAGLLGDITLARETLLREAEESGVPFDHHFTHLIVHGFLHILGFDHIIEDEALAMEGLETQILEGLGIPDPHAG